MPFGIAAGLWLFQGLPKEWVQALIGCFILITLATHGLKALRNRELPIWAFVPAGVVVGVLNIVIGVVGPVLSTLLVGRGLTRQSIVSTTSVFSFLGHFMKIFGFALIWFSFVDYAWSIMAMLPSIVFGTYVGRYFLVRISDTIFKNILRVLLGGLAVKLVVWDGMMGGIL